MHGVGVALGEAFFQVRHGQFRLTQQHVVKGVVERAWLMNSGSFLSRSMICRTLLLGPAWHRPALVLQRRFLAGQLPRPGQGLPAEIISAHFSVGAEQVAIGWVQMWARWPAPFGNSPALPLCARPRGQPTGNMPHDGRQRVQFARPCARAQGRRRYRGHVRHRNSPYHCLAVG